MKIGCAAALLLVTITPALAGATRTVDKVTFTCEVTGGAKDGFSILAKNDGDADKACTASCTLTKSDKTKQEWNFPERGDPIKVKKGAPRMYFEGKAGLKGAPLTDPDVTKASCK
jgi:hypothetical protein